jgi:hypothetical protein
MTTGDNFPQNIRRGIEAAGVIMARGYVVICPHEKALGMELFVARSYDEWLEYDLRCIDICDAVYRMSACGLPLPSKGGDIETQYARNIGCPVYYSFDTLFAGQPAMRRAA